MIEFDILITEQAESDLNNIIDFIHRQWSDRVKIDFLATLSHKMHLLASMPYMYRASHIEPTVRECVINRYVTMYYRVMDVQQRIDILSFRDNRQQDNST